MKPLAVVLILLLSGCSLFQSKPEEGSTVKDQRVVVKEVQIPVKVPCAIEMPKPPIWLTEVIDIASTTPLQWSQAVLAELEQARSYLGQVQAAAKKCE